MNYNMNYNTRRQLRRLINEAIARVNYSVGGFCLSVYAPLNLTGDSPLEMLGNGLYNNIKHTQATTIDDWFDRREFEVKTGAYKSLYHVITTYARGCKSGMPASFNDDTTREALRSYFEQWIFSSLFSHVVTALLHDVTGAIEGGVYNGELTNLIQY